MLANTVVRDLPGFLADSPPVDATVLTNTTVGRSFFRGYSRVRAVSACKIEGSDQCFFKKRMNLSVHG